jgi:4-hydroxyphenylacetate 3-monooxygenase
MDATRQPLTGAQYLESLRDGREIWIDGERVDDVTEHPAFRNAARSIARLYESLHDPAQQELLTTVDRHGHRTMRFFAPAYSAAELLAGRDAIAAWARTSYGWLGRTPDYKAAFMASLGADPSFYAPFEANAARWYDDYAGQCLFLNHVLVDPPVDRAKPLEETRGVYFHVDEEVEGGVYVSGAKMMGTGSALTHATFVAQNSGSAARLVEGRTEDFALVAFIPMGTPGQKLICRSSYERRAGAPFDSPLAGRFDENDAVLVWERAFVPWENVLVYRDIERARAFYAASGFMPRFVLQAVTRQAVKLDFLCGLFLKAIASNGTGEFRGVQAAAGELVATRDLFWALSAALALDPEPSMGGSVVPKLEHAIAARVQAAHTWHRVRELFELHLGGAPLVAPASVADVRDPELRPTLDRFYRGSDRSAVDRIKLFKLIWEAVGSEFAGRHALYERNYSGNFEQMRLDALAFAGRLGTAGDMEALVDRCLADYDLDGWTTGEWTTAPPATGAPNTGAPNTREPTTVESIP